MNKRLAFFFALLIAICCGILWSSRGKTAYIGIGPMVYLPTSNVGSLPTCNAAIKGQLWLATDLLLPTLLAVVTGGGAVNGIAVCNGTNWVVG